LVAYLFFPRARWLDFFPCPVSHLGRNGERNRDLVVQLFCISSPSPGVLLFVPRTHSTAKWHTRRCPKLGNVLTSSPLTTAQLRFKLRFILAYGCLRGEVPHAFVGHTPLNQTLCLLGACFIRKSGPHPRPGTSLTGRTRFCGGFSSSFSFPLCGSGTGGGRRKALVSFCVRLNVYSQFPPWGTDFFHPLLRNVYIDGLSFCYYCSW